MNFGNVSTESLVCLAIVAVFFFAVAYACDWAVRANERREELKSKLDALVYYHNDLCKVHIALLKRANDCADKAYGESSERWAELVQFYLVEAEDCENELNQVDKMIDEILDDR